MKAIETERLFLRDMRMGDWKAVHEYASDAEVVRYMDWGPNTEDESKAFIQRAISEQKAEPRRVFTFAAVLKEDDGLIGSCGLHVSNPENREGWIGYCLRRDCWRKGLATEAAGALLFLVSMSCSFIGCSRRVFLRTWLLRVCWKSLV